jgi:transcriptional regulator with XRE-family HTH domain
MTRGSEIKAAREAKGWKQSDLARAVGTSQQNIDRIEKGVITHSRSLPKICEALGLAPANNGHVTPLVGYVGAGAEMFSFDVHDGDEPLGEVEKPQGATDTTVAVQVRGDSMKPAYKDGDLLYYDQQSNGDLTHLVGHDCVVRLADGRTFVKELRRTAGRFWLHSHNADPMLDVSIAWAAKVKWVLKG